MQPGSTDAHYFVVGCMYKQFCARNRFCDGWLASLEARRGDSLLYCSAEDL